MDSYVGKSILDNCLLSGPLADRTRILVTHALHVLDKTDYIYVMDNGSIIAQGTYEVQSRHYFRLFRRTHIATQDLMENSVVFSHLMEEYGNLEAEADSSKSRSKAGVKKAAGADGSTEGGLKKDNAALMQTEERNTGAVTWTVYKKYLGFAGGIIWAPIIILLLTLTQAAQGVFCLWYLYILAQSCFSWQQSIPWILDRAEHP